MSDLSDSDPDAIGNQFEEFYQAYPRRQAKREAETAWRKLNPDEALRKRLLSDVAKRYRGTETTFIPLPAKYLEGARWNDELIVNRTKAETPIDISKRLIREAEVPLLCDRAGSPLRRFGGLAVGETDRKEG